MLPMISPAFSSMRHVVRAMGHSDTNIVESHNRRGNFHVDKPSSPEEAIKCIAQLDKIDEILLLDGYYDKTGKSHQQRVRREHTLAPSGSRTPAPRNKRRATEPPRSAANNKKRGVTNAQGGGSAAAVRVTTAKPQSVQQRLLRMMDGILMDDDASPQTKTMTIKTLGELFCELVECGGARQSEKL